MTKPRTLYDKIWDDHLVDEQPDGTCLLYIDRHLVHEVTSPQAFEGLRLAGRPVHAPEKTLCVVDHNVPTTDRAKPNEDPESAAQIAYLAENAKHFGLEYYDELDKLWGQPGKEKDFAGLEKRLVTGEFGTLAMVIAPSVSKANQSGLKAAAAVEGIEKDLEAFIRGDATPAAKEGAGTATGQPAKR